MTFRRKFHDVLAISDAVTKIEAKYNISLGDTLQISDSTLAAAAYKIALADNLTISDVAEAAATYAVALADQMDISDAIAVGWKFYVELADQMDISDKMTCELFEGVVKKKRAAAMVRKIGWPTPINVGMGA